MKSKSKPLKVEALREDGTLNLTPEQVRDPKFQDNEFFDPHDVVQVKYEMLRRVSVEKALVSAASEEYGVSRPTYYQTKASPDFSSKTTSRAVHGGQVTERVWDSRLVGAGGDQQSVEAIVDADSVGIGGLLGQVT